MENNNKGNKGVFPGAQVPSQGTIQTAPPVVGAQNTAALPTNISHHENVPIETSTEVEPAMDTNTYIKLETKNSEEQVSGIIEVDLISFRERGQESRFLSVNTTGANAEGEPSTTTINIDNEADFNRFKKFISQLNWND